jgi:hypothetical protein
MKTAKRCSLLVIVLSLLLNVSLSADFAVRQEMVIYGIPMMGNMTMNQTYLIKGGNLAVEQSMKNPMMPQMSTSTRSIIKGGEEIVIINFIDSSYSVHGKGMVDSLNNMFDMQQDMIDSLKEMMTINEIEMGMSGKKRQIQGHNAEEMTFNADIDMQMQMMGPEPMPMNVKVTGSYWGTKDFADYENYKNQVKVIEGLFMQSGQSGLSGIVEMLEKLGVDEKMAKEAMNFSEYLMLEGNMDIVIDMELPEEVKQSMGQMFQMPMTMKINTNLIEATTTKIESSKFSAPEGFKKVDNAMTQGGGGFSFPGMGQ